MKARKTSTQNKNRQISNGRVYQNSKRPDRESSEITPEVEGEFQRMWDFHYLRRKVREDQERLIESLLPMLAPGSDGPNNPHFGEQTYEDASEVLVAAIETLCEHHSTGDWDQSSSISCLMNVAVALAGDSPNLAQESELLREAIIVDLLKGNFQTVAEISAALQKIVQTNWKGLNRTTNLKNSRYVDAVILRMRTVASIAKRLNNHTIPSKEEIIDELTGRRKIQSSVELNPAHFTRIMTGSGSRKSKMLDWPLQSYVCLYTPASGGARRGSKSNPSPPVRIVMPAKLSPGPTVRTRGNAPLPEAYRSFSGRYFNLVRRKTRKLAGDVYFVSDDIAVVKKQLGPLYWSLLLAFGMKDLIIPDVDRLRSLRKADSARASATSADLLQRFFEYLSDLDIEGPIFWAQPDPQRISTVPSAVLAEVDDATRSRKKSDGIQQVLNEWPFADLSPEILNPDDDSLMAMSIHLLSFIFESNAFAESERRWLSKIMVLEPIQDGYFPINWLSCWLSEFVADHLRLDHLNEFLERLSERGLRISVREARA